MKKICLYLCSVICCIVTLIFLVKFSNNILPEEEINNTPFEFSLNEDKTAYTVTGSDITGKPLKSGLEIVDLTIPAEYKGLPVTKIGFEAFRDSPMIQSVIIPESIERITAGAFDNCVNLKSVFISKSVKYLSGAPFERCSALQEIAVDTGNEYYCSIDGNLYTKDQRELIFYAPGKRDTEFKILERVSVVRSRAFSHCKNLKRIIIPHTVADFPYDAIICNLPEGVYVDKNNPKYSSIDGNLYSKDNMTFLRLFASEENYSLVIPEGVTTIEHHAMYSCDNLEIVTFPKSLTLIQEEAFLHCSNLSGVIFEDPSNWSITPSGGKFSKTRELTETELNSPTTAAKHLTEHYSCKWHKGN